MSKKRSRLRSLSLFADLPTSARPRRNRKTLGIPAGLDLDRYEVGEDGRLQEVVGPWAREKHAVVEKYVGYTRGVRRTWIQRGPAGATYVDLFSGPGRARIRGTEIVLDGSPLVAWNKRGYGDFTNIYVADASAELVQHCKERLELAGAPVDCFVGEANKTVDKVIEALDRRSYHFAFLDPYNLGNLSFDVIRKLASLKSVDILAHVSAQDLNRNLRLYIEEHGSSLDQFVPGWRERINVNLPDPAVRESIFGHWKSLLQTIDMRVADAVPLVTGSRGQPLYWLAFASRHRLAHKFWKEIQPPAGPIQDSFF